MPSTEDQIPRVSAQLKYMIFIPSYDIPRAYSNINKTFIPSSVQRLKIYYCLGKIFLPALICDEQSRPRSMKGQIFSTTQNRIY
jgi:hypothetical protein